MRSTSMTVALAVLARVLASAADVRQVASADSAGAVRAESAIVRPVAGSGTHYLTTAIVHSTEPSPTGMIQRSTETVDLTGDLTGRILYHPTSVFDFVNGTLTNTGHQVFSGTVLGSAPVMLHDDERVPVRRQLLERVQQNLVVARMQADGGLVQHVAHALQI